jgi:hypothetical protein
MERGQAFAAAVPCLVGALTLYVNNHHYSAGVLGVLLLGFVAYGATKQGPLMRVEFSTTIIAQLGGKNIPCVQVRIENHSSGDLTFTRSCASLHWRGSKTSLVLWNTITDVIFPHTLAPGNSFIMMTAMSELTDALRGQSVYVNSELRAVVSDAIGRRADSSWQKLPDREWFKKLGLPTPW